MEKLTAEEIRPNIYSDSYEVRWPNMVYDPEKNEKASQDAGLLDQMPGEMWGYCLNLKQDGSISNNLRDTWWTLAVPVAEATRLYRQALIDGDEDAAFDRPYMYLEHDMPKDKMDEKDQELIKLYQKWYEEHKNDH